MRWTDIQNLAEMLVDTHPTMTTEQVQWIRFTDLHRLVVTLPGFADDPQRSNEKILEAIQAAWLAELTS